jgi:Dolichyl-phosphate-mannose-protein mannosyltransferase
MTEETSEDSVISSYPKINNQSFLVPVIGLLVLTVFIVVFRTHTYAEPLERDITTHAIIGHGLLSGQPLYSDLWDHKPPATYITHAIGELIFGFGNNAIYGINVVASTITLIAVYFAGTRYSGGPITGLAAGAFWVLLSQSVAVEANQPNSEAFMNCCLSAVFAILINSKRLENKTVFFAGLLTTLATLYKQIALVPVCFLLVSRIIFSDSQNRKKYFAEAISIAIIVALSWFLVATWFLETDSFPEFYQAVFAYNINYSQHGVPDKLKTYWDCLTQGLSLDPYVQGILTVATTVGIAKIIRMDPVSKLWLHWLVYLVGMLVAIILPHHPFAHYFQLVLPLTAIGGAWGLNSLQNSFLIGLKTLFSHYKKSLTSFHCICLQICLTLMFFGPLFSERIKKLCLAPDEWSLAKYTQWFIADKTMGEKLKSLLLPQETVYVWGDASTLYFYSGHFPIVSMFFSLFCNDTLMREDLSIKWSTRVMLELSTKHPDMIIVSCATNKDEATCISSEQDRRSTMARHIVTSWIDRNYHFYKTVEVEDKYYGFNRYFALFVLPNSGIYSRLCNPTVNSKK